ncbi:Cilia- and flagella-associated protein [Dirofilaria immitis]
MLNIISPRTFVICIDLIVIAFSDYFPLQNAKNGEFGLKDQYGIPCLLLKFSAQLYNFNLNSTHIATKIPELTSPKVKLSGNCAGYDTNNSEIQFKANWKKQGRKKQLIMSFGTAYMKNPVNQLEEFRWQLKTVSYSESYFSQMVEFSSQEVTISAPLKQKFICRDKLNLTLTNKHFKDCILELNPEINAQPYYRISKHPSLFICGSTRRRTLAKSFESRMTIFSGIVLCITSVSLMVGYTFRRQSHPNRKKLYELLT